MGTPLAPVRPLVVTPLLLASLLIALLAGVAVPSAAQPQPPPQQQPQPQPPGASQPAQPAPLAPDPSAPLYRHTGQQYRVYNFPGTGESIPYRLFVPTTWTTSARLPMLVTLRAG